MNILPWKNKTVPPQLVEQIKQALALAIPRDGGQIIIINNLTVKINYASGGGATVNVKGG